MRTSELLAGACGCVLALVALGGCTESEPAPSEGGATTAASKADTAVDEAVSGLGDDVVEPTSVSTGGRWAVAPPEDQADSAPAAPPDDAADAGDPPAAPKTYGDLLARIVTTEGLVRYDLLDSPETLAALQDAVAGFAAASLPEDEAERLALWCNAYNANVLLMAYRVSRQPDFENVSKVAGFFDSRQITVAGESMTLNGLENDRIRKLGDARIHAALVCAAVSCPPLRPEPYKAATLEEQLDHQSYLWLRDRSRNRVEDEKLAMSSIFEWYREDFEREPYNGIVGFIKQKGDRQQGVGMHLRMNPDPPITFLEYDWALNQAPPGSTTFEETAAPAGG